MRWWPFQREVTLLAMHLENMHIQHPQQDNSHVCAICGETVGLYPSGQAVLRRYRKVKIVCEICQTWTANDIPAPGALAEIGEGVAKKEPR